MRNRRFKKEVFEFTDILGNIKKIPMNKNIIKESINKVFRESVGDFEYAYLNI